MPLSGTATPTPRVSRLPLVPKIIAQPCSLRAQYMHCDARDILAQSFRTVALFYPDVQLWKPHSSPTQWHSQGRSPVWSPDQGVSALTAGFRPSLSSVFLLKGPSMVGTAAEFPRVQMHGPVGLRGDHQSDAVWRS